MFAQPLRIALIAITSVVGLSAAANAAHPSHGHYCEPPLPRFGMHSYNNGYGEVVVRINHGGIACELGLEEGDLIERFNHQRLSYHGSWEDALAQAMADGGHIVLRVRDVHTGRRVTRHIDLDPYGRVVGGPIGPVTPKVVVPSHPAPPVITPKVAPHMVGYRGRFQGAVAPPVQRDSRPRFSFRIGL
ncbi:hypothetical protein Pla123a_02090 [Posidoniimonas polymericola]|uniref:PDZ domain-containing protein n=1 Tax=Posidoniimonas polymericola TaxID=2528002 RepID=A0A5C5ZDJ2_9BACT|nr:hypothetical protein [Posidoniimonas polymericola]TWT85402.1 hypothetical protein Pla123a_02090 [Posidoniimonas polymericola]